MKNIKVGDVVKVVAKNDTHAQLYKNLIGEIGVIKGFNIIGNPEIYFGKLPACYNTGSFNLHCCGGKYKENKYYVLPIEMLDVQPIKKDNIETSNKYEVIKLDPTENQERQYGVMLFKYIVNITNGQTIAFINSKISGGVIYGKKAGALLTKLKQNNPNKAITIVKKLKSQGMKQISIKIVDRVEINEFTL